MLELTFFILHVVSEIEKLAPQKCLASLSFVFLVDSFGSWQPYNFVYM